MAIGSEITTDIMHKTGRDLLPKKTVEYFLEIRDIEHWNIVNKTVSEYTMAEWLACLKEKVLLEQCLPIYSQILDEDPLAHGIFAKGELLYDVTQIDNAFWKEHQEWHEYFITRVKAALELIENDSNEIIQEYVNAYRRFLE